MPFDFAGRVAETRVMPGANCRSVHFRSVPSTQSRPSPRPAANSTPRVRFLALAALQVALTGCGQHPDEPVVLNFWAMGREGEVAGELIRDFERAHPQIRVRVQQMPWTSAHEKLLTAFAGDVLPDLCQLGNTWVPEFHALGALEDLSSQVSASDAVKRDDYFAGIWDTNVIAGRTFGVPWYVDTRCVFYRADILAAAGVETFPTSWEDWRHAMQRVKQHLGDKNFAILLPTNEWAPPVILGLQTGDTLLREEGRYGNFRSAELRRAFDFYVGLFRQRLAPNVSNTEVSNIYQEFARGYFAMYITGPWNIGEFQRRLGQEMTGRWATAPIPGPDGPETGVSLAGGSSLALFRTSKHKAEAWRLVEFLSQPEQQTRFYRLAGALPPRKSVWQTAGLADDPHARAFYLQLGRVRPTPKVPEWERIATEIFHRAESIIQGDESIDDGLEKLDADVDRILEKRRWMLDRKRRRGEPMQG